MTQLHVLHLIKTELLDKRESETDLELMCGKLVSVEAHWFTSTEEEEKEKQNWSYAWELIKLVASDSN